MTVTVLRDVGGAGAVNGYLRTCLAARGNLAELRSDKSAVHRGVFSITHECGWCAWKSSALGRGVK